MAALEPHGSGQDAPARAWPASHRRRLRELWRSAGWPSRDLVEIELLAAGLVERVVDGAGRETLRVTDAGIRLLAQTIGEHRAARDPHESLVARVVREQQRAGRIAWRGLSLRAALAGGGQPYPPHATGEDEASLPGFVAGDAGTEAGATRWVVALPDVFSIRHTTLEDHADPVVHEIKARRADLLADLRRPDKGAAYRALGARCWYVLRAGIAEADEVPAEFGVLIAHPHRFEVARPAPSRRHRVPFVVWMALARAAPEPEEPAQRALGGDSAARCGD